jgi:hypothetical protein
MSQPKFVARNNVTERSITALLATTVGLVACLTLSTPAAGQCLGKPASRIAPSGLKLTIRTEKSYGETSRSLTVHIELTNGSKAPVAMSDRMLPERDYELHVRDAQGAEVPLTEFGRNIRSGPIKGSQNTQVLAPGESYTTEEDLSKLYAITIPGKYTIEACRDVYTWGLIYSNKIDVAFIQPAVQ